MMKLNKRQRIPKGQSIRDNPENWKHRVYKTTTTTKTNKQTNKQKQNNTKQNKQKTKTKKQNKRQYPNPFCTGDITMTYFIFVGSTFQRIPCFIYSTKNSQQIPKG